MIRFTKTSKTYL